MNPIEAVIERMEAIAAALPADDGLAHFNELYLAVTRSVAAEAGGGGFEDETFLTRLDVAFAGLYFDAVEAAESEAEIPRAWEPLFDARARKSVAPIQFALAGMNAHINHDLCTALVETHRSLDLEPERDSPQHRDYLKVNRLLERVEKQVKHRLSRGLVGVADRALGRVDDVIAIWKVARARDAAWTHSEALWALRPLPQLADDYLLTLGRLVGFAGRGLLVPTL